MPARCTAALCALLLVAACGDAPERAQPGADALGLSAVAVYGRHSAVRGKVDVRIANAGASPVELVSLQLRSPLYAEVPPTDRASTLPPDGRPRIVPVPFGDVRCEAEDGAAASVLVGVRTDDGVVDVPVPLTDGEPGLARAHRLSCASAAVARAADLQLGPPWERVDSPDGPLLKGVLRAERRGAGDITVTQLLGNILFDVTAAAPVLHLRPGADAVEAQVLVAATRCDPHALTESKTSFTFPLFAVLDAGEEVATSVTATGAGRDALQALLDDTCGAP